MSSDMKSINRETYDFLSYLGDVGGLNEMLRLFFSLIATPFGAMRLSALLTNRLYHLVLTSSENKEAIKVINDDP